MPAVNPNMRKIQQWHMKAEMGSVGVCCNDSKRTLVNTRETLKEAAREIGSNKVLVFATRCHDWESYLGMTTIIQIAGKSNIYIVDALVLFDIVAEYLGHVFTDPNILKLAYGPQEIQILQRDFNIYPVRVIHSQEAFQILYDLSNVTYKDMVAKLLQKDMKCLQNRVDYRIRPLSADAIKIAADEILILSRCWEKLIYGFGELMEYEEFAASKAACLEVYSQPEPVNIQHSWRNCIEGLHPDLRSIFDIPLKFDLFSTLLTWRHTFSVTTDVKPDAVVSCEKLAFITRAMPKSFKSLRDILKTETFLQTQQVMDLLEILGNFQIEPLRPENETMSNSVHTPQTSVKRDYSQILELESHKHSDIIQNIEVLRTVRFKEDSNITATHRNFRVGKTRKTGIAEKVKLVIHLALKLRLTRDDIQKYMYKFPESPIPISTFRCPLGILKLEDSSKNLPHQHRSKEPSLSTSYLQQSSPSPLQARDRVVIIVKRSNTSSATRVIKVRGRSRERCVPLTGHKL
ncbi:unnamed protein product [Orchesella dallaii]|uniref:HRDC domain-containing protein n=1 Tax=Orchesella dallaii TaxID=48710 RepID=A0ABP1RPG3_9HEXA